MPTGGIFLTFMSLLRTLIGIKVPVNQRFLFCSNTIKHHLQTKVVQNWCKSLPVGVDVPSIMGRLFLFEWCKVKRGQLREAA